MVFPEGTRSEDCSILRFHRGAFYLAEKLNIDIIPVVLHGLGHALPKKEMLLRKGKATVKIMKRIKNSDLEYGENYSERTRNIRRMYIDEYKRLATEIETPEYYHNLVLHNFVYKGANIERTARKLLSRFNDFEELIEFLPDKGKILILECGFGTLPLMIALVKKELDVIATDNDHDRLDIARNCVSNPSNLHYFEHSELQKNMIKTSLIAGVDPSGKIVEECILLENDFIFLARKTNFYLQNFVYKGCLITEGKSSGTLIIKKEIDGEI